MLSSQNNQNVLFTNLNKKETLYNIEKFIQNKSSTFLISPFHAKHTHKHTKHMYKDEYRARDAELEAFWGDTKTGDRQTNTQGCV